MYLKEMIERIYKIDFGVVVVVILPLKHLDLEGGELGA